MGRKRESVLDLASLFGPLACNIFYDGVLSVNLEDLIMGKRRVNHYILTFFIFLCVGCFGFLEFQQI